MVNVKEKNFVSAVVYVHDNENEIREFVSKLAEVLTNNFEKFEIICVNDHSKDNSLKNLKEYSEGIKNATISIVNMSYYQGVELSMNAGVDLAIGDFVFEFDTMMVDYPINTIMDVYFRSLQGFDIVSATPSNCNKYSSKLFYKFYNHFSNSGYKLRTESFRILSRRAINRVHSMSITIPYRKAIYANCGLKLDHLEYDVEQGKISHVTTKQIHKIRKAVAVDSLILFTNIAHKISIGMTILMMLTTTCMAGYSLYIFFGRNSPVEGWTTTILFLSVAFFGLFAILAIVIKYLSIIIDLVFKKQKYIIESIEKVTK